MFSKLLWGKDSTECLFQKEKKNEIPRPNPDILNEYIQYWGLVVYIWINSLKWYLAPGTLGINQRLK